MFGYFWWWRELRAGRLVQVRSGQVQARYGHARSDAVSGLGAAKSVREQREREDRRIVGRSGGCWNCLIWFCLIQVRMAVVVVVEW